MFSILVIGLWVGWVISWYAAAFFAAKPARSVSLASELPFRALLLIGTVILAVPAHGYHGSLRLWQVHRTEAWLCVLGIAAGIAFTWWARIHLGRLWSGRITRKEDHHIVDTGPYGIVRHPIYTGMSLALLSTAAIKGTIPGIVGAALVIVSFWIKARMEERWLTQELGVEAYGAYRKRVPMLIPFGPKG